MSLIVSVTESITGHLIMIIYLQPSSPPVPVTPPPFSHSNKANQYSSVQNQKNSIISRHVFTLDQLVLSQGGIETDNKLINIKSNYIFVVQEEMDKSFFGA